MPVLSTLGAMSSRGFGQNASVQANYIEDYFSTYLYNGTGANQTITNNIPLVTTASWTTYKLVKNNVTGGYGSNCKIDSNGNIYLLGMTLDGIQYTTLAKYNSSNVLQWQRKIAENNTTATDNIGIAIDSSNDVYVVTTAKDATREYILLAKYSSAGSLQWQRKIYQNDSYSGGIAIDSSNNIYISGLVLVGAALYGFIAKYDTSGSIQWQRSYSQGRTAFRAIAVDSSANVYAIGVINQDGTNDCISLVKYNSSGTLQWERQLRQNTSYGEQIVIDSSGNIYLIGTANDGTNTYAITAKYNSSGTLQWQRKIKTNNSYGYAITLDSSSNVYIAGLLDNGANARPFTAKYDSSGALQWQRQFLEYGIMNGVAVTSSGDLYLAGIYSLSSVNSLCLIKLKTDGSVTAGSAILTIQLGAGTESAAGATSSTPTGTSATSTYTDAAGTATDSAGTATESSATQAATNGSGLVWTKYRSGGAENHYFWDTARGPLNYVRSPLNGGQATLADTLTSFNTNGFSLGSDASANTNGAAYVSWTFREQVKFFDIVTYTGNGANRTISHNLGSVPGMILIKRTDTTGDWTVYHRSLANTEYIVFNTTTAKATGATYWNSTTPTSTVFSLGTAANVNANNGTYVAYLFAHNAGGFGIDGSQSVISCGSYTGNGSATGPTVNLGWEPQFVIIKMSSSTGDWNMFDNLRGIPTGAADPYLFVNTSQGEQTTNGDLIDINATGFSIKSTNAEVNTNTGTYIYIAIRRGPMAIPTDATKVFQPTVYTGTNVDNRLVDTTIAPDMVWVRQRNDTVLAGMVVGDRMRGQPYLLTGSANAQVTAADAFDQQLVSTTEYGTAFSSMVGFWCGNNATAKLNANTTASNHVVESFKRAPSFFDIVYYTGNGGTQNVTHNLTVPPEFMIIKMPTAFPDFITYYGNTGRFMYLSYDNASSASSTMWDNTAPTKTVFTVGSDTSVNGNANPFIAYLFASCPGVSKVSTYTGTGTTNQINCGFSAGARFILIKRTDSTGDWYVYDTARGITASNDPYLLLSSTAAEVTNTDYINTFSGGFTLTSTAPAALNANGGTYFFVAIA